MKRYHFYHSDKRNNQTSLNVYSRAMIHKMADPLLQIHITAFPNLNINDLRNAIT